MPYQKWRDLRLSNPLLFWNGILSLILFILLLPLYFFDTRTLLGVAIWIKPIKFAISLTIYSFTLLWILQFIEGKETLVKRLSWVICLASWFEIFVIALQAFRGVRSHFNVATPLDAILFSSMGTVITCFWLVHLFFAYQLMRQKTSPSLLHISIVHGMWIAAVGMILGFVMTQPTSEQISLMQAGSPQLSGRHTFGAADGGPGLPLVGWSKQAGDLRIAHFFGIHAMQVLPFFAFLAFGKESTKSKQGMRLISLSYGFFTLILTIQALRGEALFHPSIFVMTLFIISSFILLVGLFLLLSPQQLQNKLEVTS
ncbi:MAG: hypothetical protein AAF518_04170 [Spirochaetota bacterium]